MKLRLAEHGVLELHQHVGDGAVVVPLAVVHGVHLVLGRPHVHSGPGGGLALVRAVSFLRNKTFS